LFQKLCNKYLFKDNDLCLVAKLFYNLNYDQMKTNEVLQKDVEDAIKWEPLLNAAEIGVTAKDGIVTLTGVVDSYAKKLEAENATEKVAGVTAIIEKIEINLGNNNGQTNTEIANEVLNALKDNWKVPSEKVKVKVEDGCITLEGELSWNYQKEAAKNSVTNLIGVRGVINNITIKAETHDEIERKDVERALERSWAVHNENIKVEVRGTKVILTGAVNSLFQKGEAARIAWNVPGVWIVDNELVIEYNYSLSI